MDEGSIPHWVLEILGAESGFDVNLMVLDKSVPFWAEFLTCVIMMFLLDQQLKTSGPIWPKVRLIWSAHDLLYFNFLL